MANGIPAASLLPPAFDSGKPEWIWAPRDVPEDQSRKLYLTSELHAGWRYYTASREVKLSKEFPSDYEKDIGYKYNHGPGKTDRDGKPMEDRAKPSGVWLARAWLVEEERMVAAVIDSFSLQSQIQKIFQNEEFMLLDTLITNFYLTIYHDKKPPTPAMTYTAQGNLRVLRNKKAYEEATKPFYPESYWKGLNPLEEPTQPPANAGLPATVRDEHGADQEADLKTEGDYNW